MISEVRSSKWWLSRLIFTRNSFKTIFVVRMDSSLFTVRGISSLQIYGLQRILQFKVDSNVYELPSLKELFLSIESIHQRLRDPYKSFMNYEVISLARRCKSRTSENLLLVTKFEYEAIFEGLSRLPSYNNLADCSIEAL